MKRKKLNKTKKKHQQKNKINWQQISQVNKTQLKQISALLYQKFQREKRDQTYAQVKEILTLLLKGGFLL